MSRSIRFAIYVSPETHYALLAYAREHQLTRSTAANTLLVQALGTGEHDDVLEDMKVWED